MQETNWEKWAGEPRPGDAAGAYSYEQLLRMDGDFTAALERAFAAGLESPLSARRIYVAKGQPTSDPAGRVVLDLLSLVRQTAKYTSPAASNKK